MQDTSELSPESIRTGYVAISNRYSSRDAWEKSRIIQWYSCTVSACQCARCRKSNGSRTVYERPKKGEKTSEFGTIMFFVACI